MRIIMLLILLLTQLSWAVTERDLPLLWDNTILPHFDSFTTGQLKKTNYFYSVHPRNKKSIVIVPGRSEAAKKYAEFIYDLKDKGINIFIMELRGQGTAPRILSDSNKGHVEHFNDYVSDLKEFMKEVVLPQSKDVPLYLVAHSLGGAISVKFLADCPNYFKKIVLNAPMLEVNTDPYSEIVARYYAKILVRIGKGEEYAPGRGPHVPEEYTFERNNLTKSRARFEAEKSLGERSPELIVAGPTANWVHEALMATKHIDKLAKKISTPILMFQAGEDHIVKPSRQNSFCSLAANCNLIKFPVARHEILVEQDEQRDKAMKLISDFFSL